MGWSYQGAELSFTIAVSVDTEAATGLTIHEAILNGDLVDIAGLSSVFVFFEYGKVSSVYTDTTIPEEMLFIGLFHADIASLDASTTYYFRAVALDGATPYYGAELSFDTQDLDHFFVWKYRDVNDTFLIGDLSVDVAPSLSSAVTPVITIMQHDFGYRIPFVCLNPDGSVYGAYHYDVVEHDFDIAGTFQGVVEKSTTSSRLTWGPVTIVVKPAP